MKIGEVIECWNPRAFNEKGERVFTKEGVIKGWQKAKIVEIHYNYKSEFDDCVYPILYDVLFIEDGLISNHHLEHAVREIKNSIEENENKSCN